jgi:hypothetical protein
MPANRRLFIIGIVALLAACHMNEEFSSPLWFYRHSSDTPSKWDSILTRFSYLYLQPDGAYTQDFGQFDYGKWTLKKHELYLTNQHNVTYIYTLPFINSKEFDILLGKGKFAYFQKQPRPSADATKNPFSLTNNQWRIPASHKESIAEIRQRLLNHFQFWDTYFKWGDDNNVGVLDTRDIPSPLKVYGNGFGLKHYTDLPAQWRSCFYDTVDCHIADTLIKGAFRRNKINWLDTDDENKKFISGIEQIEGFLR